MESSNMNNGGRRDEEKEIMEGSDSWLGGPVPKDEEIHDHDDSGESQIEHLAPEAALDG